MKKPLNFKKIAEKSDFKLLAWIVSFFHKHKQFPTLVEVGKQFHYTKARSFQIFQRLIKRGWLRKNKKGGWRTKYYLK